MKNTDEFLNAFGMHFKTIEPYASIDSFISEMETGLKKESSLEMLPTYISPDEYDYSNKKAVAIDAGGTNLRVSLISFDKNKNYNIEYLRNYPMPGTGGEIGAKEFFMSLAEKIALVANDANDIGFSFSYPTEITPKKDGRIKYLVKELKVNGVNGLLLGESLNASLKKAGIKDQKKFVVVNDTVVAMLGGKAAYPQKKYGGYIGFILGTGLNTCYAEKTAHIHKIDTSGIQKDTMIINIESGGFSKMPRGALDMEFDRMTINPGVHLMEKMVSGAYLGNLCHVVFKAAAREGILSKQTSDNILNCAELTTMDISLYLDSPNGENKLAGFCRNTEDKQALCSIADVLIERAAVCTAIMLAATVKKSARCGDAPLCITAEGTTFYHLKGLKAKAVKYLDEYLKALDLKAEMVSAENAAITGAAIAALTN